MKVPTVLAAALAAGLMTFAASGQELSGRMAMISVRPDNVFAGKVQDDQAGKAEERPAETRGLTAEEVFHAAKAAEAAKPENRYKPIIERYASENGVSIQLAHAVISVESNYKASSLGKAGEVGLMQIKPATAKLMGYAGSKTGLFDPETNIKYGMKYLGKAQKLGDGTTCGTILKYNAGHGAKRMNPISQDYCNKVKRHIDESLGWLWADRENDRGA
jgi:soluble lytic murein transglycosylase-like protein